MNSETLPGGPDLADIGPLARVEVNGVTSLLRLRALVENTAACRVLWKHIVEILDPADVCRAIIDGAGPSLTAIGESELVEQADIQKYLAEDRVIQEAEDEVKARERAEAFRHAAVMQQIEEERAANRPAVEQRQKLAEMIWRSPSRRKADRERAQRERLFQEHVFSLQLKSEQRAKEAATAAVEAVRQEFVARRAKIEAAFNAGKSNWREL